MGELCAPISLRGATGQTHVPRLSAAATDPAQGRPVTSPSSRGVPEASEAPWRGRGAPTPRGGPKRHGCWGRGPPLRPAALAASDPRTRQEPPRYNRATAVPHLLLGPGCGARAPTGPLGGPGQGGQQQQVEGAQDAPVPAACHLSPRLSARPVPAPPAVTSLGARVLLLSSSPPWGGLRPPPHLLPVASPLRCAG